MRILSLLIFICSTAFAITEQSFSSLTPEVSSVSPGKPFTVALKLDHPEGWHSYYQNSGGIEEPVAISWDLPSESSASPIQWPTPLVKNVGSSKSFIYEGSPIFLIDITPPPNLKTGDTFSFVAKVTWQICKKSCKNEDAEFTLNLPVTENPNIDNESTELFQTARNALPKRPTSPIEFSLVTDKKSTETINLHIRGISKTPKEFIPSAPFLKPLSLGGNVRPTDDGLLVTLQRNRLNMYDEPIPQGKSISGILIFEDHSIVIPEQKIQSPPPEPISFRAFLPILGSMLLGGLILNLMPCVFPVIGLKIMGFVQQAGNDRRSIALHGFTFTMGVFASFAALSGILYAVRATAVKTGGESINWGYQLQNPYVVLVLLLLMFVLALNMFGLFEIGTSATSIGGNLQTKSGLAGSFFSGVLATVVATPCSAPFLGVAIGTTMSLPGIQFFAGFAAMALGLALPYLVLSFYPKLIEKLPRPGPWMESFKQGMSFLLFATAAYLLWIYSGLIAEDKLIRPLFGLSAIAVAAWIYGRWNLPHRSKRTRFTAMILSISFFGSGIALALPPKDNNFWQPWSQEVVENYHKADTPVFIDFTARWCLTCQTNKKAAYTDEVLKLADQKGIVFLKADKTKPSPAIDAKLTELGRSAIPVNVLHVPGEEPIITPEVLTPGILIDLFNKLPDKKKE